MKKLIFNLLFLPFTGMIVVECQKHESYLVESETSLISPAMKLNSSKKIYVIAQDDLMKNLEKLLDATNSKPKGVQIRELPNKQ